MRLSAFRARPPQVKIFPNGLVGLEDAASQFWSERYIDRNQQALSSRGLALAHESLFPRSRGLLMSYLAQDAALIRAELPPQERLPATCDALFLLYAVLMRAKGEAVTAADVHDAWAAWTVSTRGEHQCLVPFESLDPDVQARDLPYVEAIRRAARRRTGP